MGTPTSADVVVVGSGSAGAVIARRLTDAGVSVVLLEAGGPDENPAIHDPAGSGSCGTARSDWGYRTVPQAACARPAAPSTARQGARRVERAERDDLHPRPPGRLRHWAYLGNAGWGYDDVLPLFRRSEDFDRGAVRVPRRRRPDARDAPTTSRTRSIAAAVAAAQEAGVPFNDDHNGADARRRRLLPLTVRDGVRESTAAAFLRPVLGAPSLTVLTGRACAACSSRAVAASGSRSSRRRVERSRRTARSCSARARSSRRSCSCSPASATADELARLGLDVAVDLPGVGKNLHDHLLSPVVLALAKPCRRRSRACSRCTGTSSRGAGPASTAPTSSRSSSTSRLPRAGCRARPTASRSSAGVDPPREPRLAPARVCRSDGASADRPGLPEPRRRPRRAGRALELCREIGRQAALAEWRGRSSIRALPWCTRGASASTSGGTAITYHHQVGTCKMGVDELAVVDPSSASTASRACGWPTRQ